jgi:hypothetical protein
VPEATPVVPVTRGHSQPYRAFLILKRVRSISFSHFSEALEMNLPNFLVLDIKPDMFSNFLSHKFRFRGNTGQKVTKAS